jgi:hypothetical protein
MTSHINIPPAERHTVRVFTLAVLLDDLHRLRADPAAIAAMLGTPEINPHYIDVFDVNDIAAIGLAQYLIDGNGVAEPQITADKPTLDAIRGPVLILTSGAASGTLTPSPQLTLIGTYAEDTPPIIFEPLPTDSASGLTGQGKAPMSDARIGGMVATIALIVLFAVTGLFIWIGAR